MFTAMPEKGKTNNPNGRPKGVPNKVTMRLREMVGNILSENYNQVVQDILKLESKERVDAWIKLLEYGLPKLQRVEGRLDISSLTNAEVDAMVDKIIASDG
jgi:hypothetical protein